MLSEFSTRDHNVTLDYKSVCCSGFGTRDLCVALDSVLKIIMLLWIKSLKQSPVKMMDIIAQFRI